MSNVLRKYRRRMLKEQGFLPNRKARRYTFRDWQKILGNLSQLQTEMSKAKQQAAEEARTKAQNQIHDAIMRENKWYRRAWRGVKGVFRGRQEG